MGTVHFNVAKLVKAVEVRGDSMAPNYNDGDWLLFRLLQAKPSDLVGKVVLIQRDSQAGKDFLQVKRVTRLTNEGIWVEGDNKDNSTDSRSWGAVDSSEVIGKLILRYRKAR